MWKFGYDYCYSLFGNALHCGLDGERLYDAIFCCKGILNVCSKMSSGGGLLCRGQSVGLRWALVDCFMYGMGFYWEFFLNRLLNCYYLHLFKLSLVSWRYLWTITFEEFTISIIIIMNIIIVITIIIIIIIIIDIIISLLLLPSHHYYY